jgi:lipoprotein-releasing system ATP-binding protein
MNNAPPRILLEATDIHKSFFRPAPTLILNGVHLKVFEKESVAVIGRSGEGKSTLLHILGTLETPCSGSLRISGLEVSGSNKTTIRNQGIGFVFQSFHLLEDYTALENVLMPARIARKETNKGSLAQERGLWLLEKVGLADKAHHPTKVLSGGEKQRVALARAMCNNPTLIFADEPSGNLDRATSTLIHAILFDFAQEEGKALVLVTHDRELASQCTRQYELKNGRLI